MMRYIENALQCDGPATSKPLLRIYLKSVGFLLLVSALGKVTMSFGSAIILKKPSPLFEWISNRQMLLLATGLEVIVAILILSRKTSQKFALISVAWLASTFALYRAVLLASGFQGSCDCLGSISDALNLSPEAANSIAVAVLFYLLLGSFAFLVGRPALVALSRSLGEDDGKP